jgi:hypothetical protein
VWIVRYNTVQEQSNTNWTSGVGPSLYVGNQYSPPPSATCRFTDFSVLAFDAYSFFGNGRTVSPLADNFQDCQVFGGQFGCSWGVTINITNCLFQRVDVELGSDSSNNPIMRNNLFWNGTVDFDPSPFTNSFVKDNLFDHANVPDESWDYGTYNGGHNAYVTNSLVTNPAFLNPTNAADKILTNSPVYQSAWLGNWYYPSGYQLIDAGHTNANLLALWHFCTTTNELPETNSIVDCGLHFVVVGTNGLPVSTGGSGIPDYLADSNGNGIYDAATDLSNWQTNNTSGSSDGVSDYIKWIQGRNIKVAALPVADTNGIVGLRVYTPLH